MLSTKHVGFGPFRLELPNGPLRRDATTIALRPKSVRLLALLIEYAGELVDKEHLMEALWPDQSVSDGGLAVCIRDIRKALGDDKRQPQFVETVHTHGYRFIGRVGPGLEHAKRWHFVGRCKELSRLDDVMRDAHNGAKRIVQLSGAPGLGKTALKDIWLDTSRALGGARVASGICSSQGGCGDAYAPLLDAIGELMTGPDKSEILANLRKFAPSWLASLLDHCRDEEITALTVPSGGGGQARMQRELCAFLSVVCQERPLVLILEDMHWSDPSSISALGVIARNKSLSNLLIVMTTRGLAPASEGDLYSQVIRELAVAEHVTEIDLDPLSEEEVRDFIEKRKESSDSVISAADAYQKTGGHPLFLTALTDFNIARGDDLNMPEAASLPRNLVAFTELRFAELLAAERKVVRAASVSGFTFTVAELESALEHEGKDLDVAQLCEALSNRRAFFRASGSVSWPDGTLTEAYGFEHAIYPELILDFLSAGERTRMHRSIADRLEQGHSDQAQKIAHKLAYHFEAGQEFDRAVPHLIVAAGVDLKKHAYVEAELLLRHGIALSKQINDDELRLPLLLELYLALGPVLVATSGYAASSVVDAFREVQTLCRNDVLSQARFSVYRGLAGFHVMRGNYEDARNLGEKILALTPEEVPAPNANDVEGNLLCGIVHFMRGDLLTADQSLQQARDAYDPKVHRQHQDQHGIDSHVVSLGYSACLTLLSGAEAEADRFAHYTLQHAESTEHAFSFCEAHSLVALYHQIKGNPGDTRLYSERAAKLASEQQFAMIEAAEFARQGWITALEGSVDAIDQIREGLRRYAETGANGGRSILLATLVEALLRAQDIDAGLDVANEALEFASSQGELVFVPELLRLKGELLHQRKTAHAADDAAACFQSSIELAERQGAEYWVQRSRKSLDMTSTS